MGFRSVSDDANGEYLLATRIAKLLPSQHGQLRSRLGIGAEHIPLNATPWDLAELIVGSVKQRDNGDLSSLIRALDEIVGGDVGELELDDEPRSRGEQSPFIPRLHVFCDREGPVKAARAAVESCCNVIPAPSSLHVFLIVGDEDQSHDLLIERLRDFELRSQGATSDDRPSGGEDRIVHHKKFNMPQDFESIEQFQLDLENLVRGQELPRSKYPREVVAERLSLLGHVVLIETEMVFGDWKTRGTKKLMAFLDFWRKWPRPTGDRRLIVCLNIRYDRRDFVDRLDRLTLAPWIWWKVKRVAGGGQDRMTVWCFRIDGVNRDHARRWLNEGRVSSALRPLRVTPSQLEDEVLDLHMRGRSWLTRRVPMKTFAKALETKVKELFTSRGKSRSPA
jgi:inactive STAND